MLFAETEQKDSFGLRTEIDMPIGIDIVIVARSGILNIKSDEYCYYIKKYGIKEINKAIEKSVEKQERK